MSDTCAACGQPIHTIRLRGAGITLEHEWVHASWLANRTHRAIPTDHEYRTVPR